jgi:hypothetical protein
MLLSRPDPVRIDVPAGAARVDAGDVVVEVERLFQVAGRIDVDPAALSAFKRDLLERDPAMFSLPEYRFRRAYLRGLRLTVRQVGARRGEGRPLLIDDDGSFAWSCPLPAGDFELVLEPRSERLGDAYPAPIVRHVAPVGVRTVEVVLAVEMGGAIAAHR